MDEITKEECSASAAKGLICAMWRALGLFAHWSHQLHLPFPAIFMRRLPPHWSQLPWCNPRQATGKCL